MTTTKYFDGIRVDGYDVHVMGECEIRSTSQESSSDYGNGTTTERWDEFEIVSVHVELATDFTAPDGGFWEAGEDEHESFLREVEAALMVQLDANEMANQ